MLSTQTSNNKKQSVNSSRGRHYAPTHFTTHPRIGQQLKSFNLFDDRPAVTNAFRCTCFFPLRKPKPVVRQTSNNNYNDDGQKILWMKWMLVNVSVAEKVDKDGKKMLEVYMPSYLPGRPRSDRRIMTPDDAKMVLELVKVRPPVHPNMYTAVVVFVLSELGLVYRSYSHD